VFWDVLGVVLGVFWKLLEVNKVVLDADLDRA
jgi:hypothetical protein